MSVSAGVRIVFRVGGIVRVGMVRGVIVSVVEP